MKTLSTFIALSNPHFILASSFYLYCWIILLPIYQAYFYASIKVAVFRNSKSRVFLHVQKSSMLKFLFYSAYPFYLSPKSNSSKILSGSGSKNYLSSVLHYLIVVKQEHCFNFGLLMSISFSFRRKNSKVSMLSTAFT